MKMHPLANLSYSGLLKLDSCPRQFYLDKCNPMNETTDYDQSVTFAFGHSVGFGIQEYLKTGNLNLTVWEMFKAWEVDLLAEDTKRKKSFWEAIFAVQKFAHLHEELYGDYELAYFNGKPAVELSFRITIQDPLGLFPPYYYRGFVDVVLRHKITGKLKVLELKTTAAKSVDAAMYKNSFQGIGYSVVLDQLEPELANYIVDYLVYNTNNYEYLLLPFPKSLKERAEWLTTLHSQAETLSIFRRNGVFPKRGQSCYDYYRQCHRYSDCGLPLLQPLEETEDETIYDVEVTFEQLVETQLAKL